MQSVHSQGARTGRAHGRSGAQGGRAAADLQAGGAGDEAERKLAVPGVADEHALLERLRPLVRRVHRRAHLRGTARGSVSWTCLAHVSGCLEYQHPVSYSAIVQSPGYVQYCAAATTRATSRTKQLLQKGRVCRRAHLAHGAPATLRYGSRTLASHSRQSAPPRQRRERWAAYGARAPAWLRSRCA